MNIYINKNDINYVLWAFENTDIRKYKKTQSILKTLKKCKDRISLIITVKQNNIFDICDALQNYTADTRMDDVHLFEVEEKFFKYKKDILDGKWGKIDKKLIQQGVLK